MKLPRCLWTLFGRCRCCGGVIKWHLQGGTVALHELGVCSNCQTAYICFSTFLGDGVFPANAADVEILREHGIEAEAHT